MVDINSKGVSLSGAHFFKLDDCFHPGMVRQTMSVVYIFARFLLGASAKNLLEFNEVRFISKVFPR